MNTYAIYIKSHCEAPDFEATVEAHTKEEAISKFEYICKGKYDPEELSEYIQKI